MTTESHIALTGTSCRFTLCQNFDNGRTPSLEKANTILELLRTEAMPLRYIATATYYAHARNSSCTAAIPIFKHLVEELRHCIATSIVAGIQQRCRVYRHKDMRKDVCLPHNNSEEEGGHDSVCSVLV